MQGDILRYSEIKERRGTLRSSRVIASPIPLISPLFSALRRTFARTMTRDPSYELYKFLDSIRERGVPRQLFEFYAHRVRHERNPRCIALILEPGHPGKKSRRCARAESSLNTFPIESSSPRARNSPPNSISGRAISIVLVSRFVERGKAYIQNV